MVKNLRDWLLQAMLPHKHALAESCAAKASTVVSDELLACKIPFCFIALHVLRDDDCRWPLGSF